MNFSFYDRIYALEKDHELNIMRILCIILNLSLKLLRSVKIFIIRLAVEFVTIHSIYSCIIHSVFAIF